MDMVDKAYSVLIPLHSEISILATSLVLFVLTFVWDHWSLGRFGPSASPFRGNLIKIGYDSTFGILAALDFVLMVIVVVCVKTIAAIGAPFSIQNLIIGTLSICVILAIVLNVWGKRYLVSKGIDPERKDGHKGFVRNYREALEKAKEKQRKKKRGPLF